MSIASQITTMQEHIEDIYDTFAVAGVDTSAAAKNIVNINANLKERLEYYLANGLDVVWNNWNKISGSGTTLSLNNTIQAKMDFVYKGNTSQSLVPSGYTQVDYITSDGNSYIDTGKTLGDNFKIETKFIHNQQSSNEQPIISTWVNSYAWFNLYIASNNQLRFYAAGNHMTANPTLTIGNINTVSYSRNDNEWVGTLNGEEVTFTTELTSSNPTTFKILARGDNTLGSYVSIYRLKLFENNTLTMDLIPCYRNSDNVIGMYDIVNNIFYTNSGTGNFTYGSVAPTPDCPIPVNVVTGDNEVKVEGKNKLNLSNLSVLSNCTISNGVVTQTQADTNAIRFKLQIYVGNTRVDTIDTINISSLGRYEIGFTYNSSLFDNIRFGLNGTQRDTTVKLINLDNLVDGRTYYLSVDFTNITQGNVSWKDMMISSIQNDTYEPYQSSQTYPINLGVKNLIDVINFAPINNNTVISLIDNGINVNNVSGGYGAKITIENLAANTNYYLSYNWKNISNGVNGVVVFAGTGTSTTLASFYNLNGGTFNTGDNTTINIWFYAAIPGMAEVEYTNIQLEEGTVKHSYTPSWFEPIELCKIGDYQDYIAKSTGKNLIDITKHTNTLASNTTILSPNSYQCESTGTWQGRVDLSFTNLKPNTDYTFSMNATQNQAIITNIIGIKDGVSTTLVQSTYVPYLPKTFNTSDYDTITMALNARGNGGSNGTIIVYNIELFEGSYTKTTIPNFEPYGKVWYKYGIIKKVVYDGSEDITANGSDNNVYRYVVPTTNRKSNDAILSNYFKQITYYNSGVGIFNGVGLNVCVENITSEADFKNWLSTHNTTVYYILNTPTVTPITDTILINQLEAIKLSYNEQTNISQTNADKPFILDVTALKDLDAEDTTPTLTTNQGLLFTQPPVSENFINDEDDNSILEETINEEEPNIEDDNREEEEPLDFFEKEIINNDEEQEEIPIEPIEIDNGQR